MNNNTLDRCYLPNFMQKNIYQLFIGCGKGEFWNANAQYFKKRIIYNKKKLGNFRAFASHCFSENVR